MKITRKDLQCRVDRLNKLLNRPAEEWMPRTKARGPLRTNVGHFKLEGNSPGDGWTRYTLALIVTEGGGEMKVSTCCTLQEMDAYISGVFSVLESTERWTGTGPRKVFASWAIR